MPVSAARCTDSVRRSSDSVPSTTHSAVAGTPARRHSSTGLRPSTTSVSSVFLCRPCAACGPPSAARLPAGWCGRALRRRGRALALESAAADTAGADRRPLLGALLAYRAAALGVACHRISSSSALALRRRATTVVRRRCR